MLACGFFPPDSVATLLFWFRDFTRTMTGLLADECAMPA